MMYNVKNSHTPTKKHQEKNTHTKKSVTSKIEDKNDSIDKMVLKNFKCKMNSQESSLTPDKSKDSKITEHSNILTNQVQSIDKHSDKRKDEKASHCSPKKLKTDDPAQALESSSESLPPKKVNKFKSMFPKTYICKYCCRRFHSVEQLRQHTNAEHANKPSHICHLCSHQAASFSALMTHYLKHSGNKRDNVEKIYAKSKADFSNLQLNMVSRPKSSVQCNKCNLTFSSKPKYDAHNCSNIPQKSEYNCAYCRHVSTTVEDYRNHIQSHSETPFTCSYCKHKSMTKKQFDNHRESCKMRLKSNVNYKCDKCNVFSTKSKKEFNNHLKTCVANVSQTCTKCGVEFKEEKSYEEHVLICGKNDSKNVESKNDNKMIENKNDNKIIESKKNHQKPVKKTVRRKRKVKESVSDKNKLLCCVCDRLCYSKSEHEEHERQCLAEMANNSNSSSNKITTSVCSTCGDTIDDGKLVEHIKICIHKNNVGLEENLLNDDPQNARRSRRLVRRKSSFTDDEEIKKRKPLKIKIPKKPKIPKLLTKPKFRRGRQSKNANNPFLCNYCDFTFCSKSTLLRHKRMHSGNPWYVCQFCGKFFFRKDVYIRHEMNVHKNSSKNMFCCYYCKLCFSETATLREHVEAIHKKSAFLPIKHNVDKNDDDNLVKKNVTIKKEKDIDVDDKIKSNISNEIKCNPSINNSHTESNSSSHSKFKCSECFEFFESASSIENHMQTHTKLSSNSKTNESFDSVNNHNIQKRKATNKTSILSQSKTKVNKFNKMKEKLDSVSNFSSTLSEKSSDNISDLYSQNDEASSNKIPDIDKLDSDTDICVSEPAKSLVCKLCLKHFSTKKLLIEHNNTVHKMVEWYQCLVCPASGPKREMLEHMLNHMYKVGSFVVADTDDYNAMICSLLNDGQKKTIEKDSVAVEKQITGASNDDILVSEDELPPLKEYGLCSCFDSKSEQEKEVYVNSPSKEYDVADIEQNKDVETLKCVESETALDFSEKNEDRKSPSNELINLSVENTSPNLSIQNPNNQCEDIFEKEVLKSEETEADNKVLEVENASDTSSPVKSDLSPNLKSVENSLDCNEAENFSQLRYLLQSPSSRHPVESKIPLYSFSQLHNSSTVFDKQNSPLKVPGQENYGVDAANIVSKHDSNFTSLDLSSKNNTNFTSLDLSSKNNTNFTSLGLPCKNNTNFTSLDLSSKNNTNFTSLDLSSKNNTNFSSLDLSSKNNIDFTTSNLLPKDDISLPSPKQNFNSCEIRDKTSTAQENNQSSNTCLRFDINQSRSEFLENINYTKNLCSTNQKNQNCTEIEKSENFFKTCPTPNAILDFSDLIQHSFENSSPSEDNIFSYSLPKQVDSTLNIGMREEVRTPDCTDMMNYDSSDYDSSLKCEKCNVLLLDLDDKLSHKCSSESVQPEQSIDMDLFGHYKPKNAFYPIANVENQNKNISLESVTEKRGKMLSPEKTAIFVCSICSKVMSSEAELVKHQKTDHAQNLQNFPHTCECTKCHRVFPDIGELMKHSLTCLRTLFLKSTSVSDCPPDSLQSFIKKEEPKPNFPVNSTLLFNTIPTDFSHQTPESLLKRSFNS